jgi:hypothetical protein
MHLPTAPNETTYQRIDQTGTGFSRKKRATGTTPSTQALAAPCTSLRSLRLLTRGKWVMWTTVHQAPFFRSGFAIFKLHSRRFSRASSSAGSIATARSSIARASCSAPLSVKLQPRSFTNFWLLGSSSSARLEAATASASSPYDRHSSPYPDGIRPFPEIFVPRFGIVADRRRIRGSL